MKFVSFAFQLIIVSFLTLITQVGGIIWCISLLVRPLLPKQKKRYIQFITFVILYTIFTFIIFPPVALIFGRAPLPISKSSQLVPHNYLTIILNRHYVTPTLKRELIQISKEFEQLNPNIKTVYLDANFPFLDGFPLLPHLSHNDGKKIDLSFHYSQNGILTNEKPSNSGYGFYEPPKSEEWDQPEICLNKGHWQYDFPKFLTLGSNQNLTFELEKTKELINLILKNDHTHKVFIEPHLKTRMGIKHKKLRYHGCQAVRHDDHIHFQVN